MKVTILCKSEKMPEARKEIRRQLAEAGFGVLAEYDRELPFWHRLFLPGQQLRIIECRKPAPEQGAMS